MSKLLTFFTVCCLGLFFSLLANVNNVYAATPCTSIGVVPYQDPYPSPENLQQMQLTVKGNLPDGRYQIRFPGNAYEADKNNREIDAYGGVLLQTVTNSAGKLDRGTHSTTLEQWDSKKQKWNDFCGDLKYKVGYEPKECVMSSQQLGQFSNEKLIIDFRHAPAGDYPLTFVGDESNGTVFDKQDLGQSVHIYPDGTGVAAVGPLTPRSGVISLRYPGLGLNANTDMMPVFGSDLFCSNHLAVIPATGSQTPRVKCSIEPVPPITVNEQQVSLYSSNLQPNTDYSIIVNGGNLSQTPLNFNSGLNDTTNTPIGNNFADGNYTATMSDGSGKQACTANFVVKKTSSSGSVDNPGGSNGNNGTSGGGQQLQCKDPKDATFNSTTDIACTTAAGTFCNPESGEVVSSEDPSAKGIKTAIGCVPTNPIEFGRTLIRFSIGIGGGIALLMMIIASFQMITSAGNADRLKAGQERFKNAVIGLLFIIFSVLLMRLIGIDILGLGKFLGA